MYVTLGVETQSGFQVATRRQILTLHSTLSSDVTQAREKGAEAAQRKAGERGGLCLPRTPCPLFKIQSPLQFKFQILKFQILSRRPEPNGPEPSRLKTRERSWVQFLPLAVGVHKGKIMGSIPAFCSGKHSDPVVHPLLPVCRSHQHLRPHVWYSHQ